MKPIKQLVPDLQKAIALASQAAASELSFQIRDQGPYWTGTFYESIRIAVGNQQIGRNVQPPTEIPSKDERPNRPKSIAVPAPKPNLINITNPFQTMYVIGSAITSEDYVNISCDLQPASKVFPAQTAEKNWFTMYLRSNQINKDIREAFKVPMAKAGF